MGKKVSDKINQIPLILLLLLVVAGILIYHHNSMKQSSVTDFSMGTVISVQVYGNSCESMTGMIVDRIQELDTKKLSWRNGESEISRINDAFHEGTTAVISEDMYHYLLNSRMLCEKSGGALDITIHPLISLWGIETDSPKIPTEDELLACRKQYDYHQLTLSDKGDEFSVQTMEPGVMIDLGALGKGIAADEIRNMLDESYALKPKRLHGAVVSIGGTILTYGAKPGRSPWQVGIRDPRGSVSDMLGTLSIQGTNVISTSGDYEQYFEAGGRRYHHILDPETGYPADNGLMSVTVVCKDGIYSDGLSTACFIIGMEDSLRILEQYDAEAVFVTTDREVYVTEGLQSSLQLMNDTYILRGVLHRR